MRSAFSAVWAAAAEDNAQRAPAECERENGLVWRSCCRGAGVLIAVLVASACTVASPDGDPAAEPTRRTTQPVTPSPSTKPPHPVSLPALMQQQVGGSGLRTRGVLARTEAYTRYAVTYESGDRTISGIMLVPSGRGRFPVLVLAHGFIEPNEYVTGQGLAREQDYLARRGYVVLHTDYRNHAGSERDPRNDVRLRLGYVEDVLAAVHAARSSDLPHLDGERVGLLGRSMGGGVVLGALVVRPGLVDAAVLFSSVSSRMQHNFERWIRGEPGRRGLAGRIIRAYGPPENAPAFWRGVSPRTYFDRVTEPVLVHHGTADSTCPIRWSRATVAALRQAGADVTYATYPGEEHTFYARWPESMRRTVTFFDRHVHTRSGR